MYRKPFRFFTLVAHRKDLEFMFLYLQTTIPYWTTTCKGLLVDMVQISMLGRYNIIMSIMLANFCGHYFEHFWYKTQTVN